ncbi:hypothetical protein BU14_0305s0010 [Porphyra umbilicalis]|uniref:Uncharacterized protein n=1 Tax=Porphyra umbilicalis TaxID=2786 RepID=A0A1X6P060_PORUM|nr:hypothetical protein BU14_0305s0010 [Porphyra umbilicalis]OSX74166.1 hypothetical protein BU14_0305s0010 [Porphyra umbilicalis]OSX74167.1 hypothetical protein BU14_0305s0010 [Porphyra umbilicalis]|eukprot:OSX74165.1 hypothetical protein BU14_0305s0010 [Porphyra umbilicalis]
MSRNSSPLRAQSGALSSRFVSGKGLQGVPAVFHRAGVPSLARRSRWCRGAGSLPPVPPHPCHHAPGRGAAVPPPCCPASRSPSRGGSSRGSLPPVPPCPWRPALGRGATVPPPCCSLASRSPLRGGASHAALLSRPSSFLTCKSP